MGLKLSTNHEKWPEEDYRKATQILVEASVEIALFNSSGKLLLFGKNEPRAVHPSKYWIAGKRKMLGESDRQAACRILLEKYGIVIKQKDAKQEDAQQIRNVDCYDFVRIKKHPDGTVEILRHKESKIMKYHLSDKEYDQVKRVVKSGENGYNEIVEKFPGELILDKTLDPSLQCLGVDLSLSQLKDIIISKKKFSDRQQREYADLLVQAHTLTELGDERIFYTEEAA